MRPRRHGATVTAVRRIGARIIASHRSDVVVAAALLALAQFELWHGETYQGDPVFPGPRLVNALVVIPLITLPLAARRRRPLAAFAVVLTSVAVASVVLGGDEATAFFLAVLVSIYSAVANGATPRLVLPLALGAIAVHEARDPHERTLGSVVWALGFVVLAALFGLAVRGRHQRIVSLETDQDRRAREAVAAERARVARELHDVVAHAVSVVVVQAQAGQRLVGRDDDGARDSLVAIENTARGALGEMRRLLGLLRETEGTTDLAPQPSLRELEQLATHVRGAGLPVSIDVVGEPVPLPPGVELSAYRIVQEGLTNALKHARAANAIVRLHYAQRALEVEVTDDGRGRGGAVDGGHGLAGMRERVALYGGVFESGPRAGGGWRLYARLPLEAS
jgi:signal transduction histidine kinase